MSSRTIAWCDECGKELYASEHCQWAANAANGHRYYDACRGCVDKLRARILAEVKVKQEATV